jgi:glucose-6-phosphate isomerase
MTETDRTAAWHALEAHRASTADTPVLRLFEADPARFDIFSANLDDLLLDYSKTSIDIRARDLLVGLARACGVEGKRDAMFAAEPINLTEGRAVLHTALRAPANATVTLGGRDVMGDVRSELARLYEFADSVRSGRISAGDGKPFTDVVNIGIGGSDLGPAMATLALAPYHDGPRLHYVSNVDGAHLADTLKGLDPARTLFIVASKTFTTIETMTNARSARAWLVAARGEKAVRGQFAAVSTALDKVDAFGIARDRTFGFWDWVGGRYSLWSAIGLPVMIAIGPERFAEMLAGGHALDEHFRTAPPEVNLPILLGLVGVWHRDVCGYATRALIPYDQRLSRLPAYVQQLDMESNGKRVTRDGKPVAHPTGPVVWGEPGTNAQHAFFQLIHQGTDPIPVEFLIAAQAHETGMEVHHELLMANCLAQSEALLRGRTPAQAAAQLVAAGRTPEDADRLSAHRTFPGSRPSLMIAYRKLDPFTLGRLIALFEHRVFVEAAIWDINAFDQWGVELGKELATRLQPIVSGEKPTDGLDSSTAGLVKYLRDLR